MKKHVNPLKIIEIDETSYLTTLPKEPECSTTSKCTVQKDLASAMSLAEAEEAVEALGVSDNDTGC